MRRRLHPLVVAAFLVVFFGGLAAAQIEIPGYVVTDLHLISEESKDTWSEAWTGPIQAATILAWYAEHGYPAFLRDFNGDGVIDELDTIELADILGRTFMGTETVRGTTDVRLVLGLARYVAQVYPNEFSITIYDAGFGQEFAAEAARAFASDVVDGIELIVEGDPSIGWYEAELLMGEGVILGLEQEQGNTYLTGRSFLYEKTPAGETPIDLAWAREDRWTPETQGQVLETVGRMEDGFLVDFRGTWTLAEFMLALSPITDPSGTGEPAPCPDDAVAYDVMVTTLGRYGSIEVEECVTREEVRGIIVDTYTYTVTNIDFLYDGCGLCMFAVPKPVGLWAIGHTEDVPWLFSELGPGWVWRLPVGHCGILPGQSAVFSVSVPGPTTDTVVNGAISSCHTVNPDGSVTLAQVFGVKTTGPGAGCPDLVVRITDQACRCDPIDGVCTLTVWADVVNIGTAPVIDAFDVVLRSLDHPANVGETYTPPPALDPGDVWPVELTIHFPMGDPLCPTDYEIVVDPEFLPGGFVQECDETNNNALGSIDCFCEEQGACCLPDGSCIDVTEPECRERGGIFYPGTDCSFVRCPPPEEECPDLIAEIIDVTCRNIGATAPLYEVTVEVDVTNIGTVTANNVRVRVEAGSQSDTDLYVWINPSQTRTTTFTFNFGVNSPPSCPLRIRATADPFESIDECDEDNNEDTANVYCPNCR